MEDKPDIKIEAFENAKKRSGPIKSALAKGLAILLPALITIAVFAWAWGVLHDYAVVSIIRAIDSIEVMESPEELLVSDHMLAKKITYDQLDTSIQKEQVWITPDNLVYRFAGKKSAKGAEDQLSAEADPKRQEENKAVQASLDNPQLVYLLPDTSYSAMDILSAKLNQQRHYDYNNRRVVTFTLVEYGVAIVVTIFLIVLLGIFAKNYFGRRLVGGADWLMQKLPVANMVYPYAKQVVDFFFSDQKQIEFDAVVACEWPREGCWQLGFVTGAGMKTLSEKTNGITHTTVFIPMSPIPMTGFTVFVPKEQVLQVDISVEEACMIILSGGVLTPPSQVAAPDKVKAEDFERRVEAARDERKTMTKRQTAIVARTEASAKKQKAEQKPNSDKDPS